MSNKRPGETAFQAERREKAEARAARLRRGAERSFAAARGEVAAIPMGQPILVGHHSEKKHRGALARHDAKMRKGVELDAAASRAESAAKRAGRAILAEDPEALDALRAKLSDLETNLAEAKRLNAAWRRIERAAKKAGVEADFRAGLEAEGFPPKMIAFALRTMELCPWMGTPMDTKNTAANIRRVAARIAELEAEAERGVAEPIVGDGFEIEEDAGACRIRIRFAARTDDATYQMLRREGFVYSRRESAFQRKLNENGRRAALRVATALGWTPSPTPGAES